MIKPDHYNTYWNIKATDNTVRICLHQILDTGYFYTSLEKLDSENNWIHVVGSSRGHTNSESKALKRIQKILETYNTFS